MQLMDPTSLLSSLIYRQSGKSFYCRSIRDSLGHPTQ